MNLDFIQSLDENCPSDAPADAVELNQPFTGNINPPLAHGVFDWSNDEVSDGWPGCNFRIGKGIPGQPFAPPKS
jgi:hypothetical protein